MSTRKASDRLADAMGIRGGQGRTGGEVMDSGTCTVIIIVVLLAAVAGSGLCLLVGTLF